MTGRPFAPACERNRQPILECLDREFADVTRVLEIGSGTGQHAAWFAAGLPHLTWVATDLADRLPGIRAWLSDVVVPNPPEVLALDVDRKPWPDVGPVDAAFSANTTHVMARDLVPEIFAGLGECLPPGAPFCLYGPFRIEGRHTGPGNAAFHASLRAADPATGIRDVAWLTGLAGAAGFVHEKTLTMPADNRIVVWRKH